MLFDKHTIGKYNDFHRLSVRSQWKGDILPSSKITNNGVRKLSHCRLKQSILTHCMENHCVPFVMKN